MGKQNIMLYIYLISRNGVAHSFIWILIVPDIGNEAAYIEFFEKIINAQLPNHLRELAGNATMNVASQMVDFLLRAQFLKKALGCELSCNEKQEVLTW